LGSASRVRPGGGSLAWLTLPLALCSTLPAHASGASYRLQMVRAEGAASCPAAAVIERDVAQRLGRNPFTDTGERGIEIVLSRSEGRWRANLYLRVDPTEPDAARLIESDASDCSELGKSVALAVALAIAPELPELAPPPEPACPPPPPAPPPSPPPVLLPASLHGTAALRVLFSPTLLPKRAFGAALDVSLHGELLGANFGAIFYPESSLHDGEAHLGFSLSAAFASGCLWARTRDPEIWSCIGGRVGALNAGVYSPRPERPGQYLWWAASSELGLRQQLFGRFAFDAGVAAVFPFSRQRFQIASAGDASAAVRPIYQQGAAAIEAFAGLALRLD
jgi:hypothetical protein